MFKAGHSSWTFHCLLFGTCIISGQVAKLYCEISRSMTKESSINHYSGFFYFKPGNVTCSAESFILHLLAMHDCVPNFFILFILIVQILSIGAGQMDKTHELSRARKWGMTGWVRPIMNIMMDGTAGRHSCLN